MDQRLFPTNHRTTLSPPLRTSIQNDQRQITVSSGNPEAKKPFRDCITEEGDVKDLFEKMYPYLPNDIIIRILFYFFDLKSILCLRLISKALLDFVSTIDPTHQTSLLAHKAAIPFKYSQLFPNIDPSVREKDNFANNQCLHRHKTGNLSDFHLFDRLPSFDYCFDRKKIILEINSFDECKMLTWLFGLNLSVYRPLDEEDSNIIYLSQDKLNKKDLLELMNNVSSKLNKKEFKKQIYSQEWSKKSIRFLINIKELNLKNIIVNFDTILHINKWLSPFCLRKLCLSTLVLGDIYTIDLFNLPMSALSNHTTIENNVLLPFHVMRQLYNDLKKLHLPFSLRNLGIGNIKEDITVSIPYSCHGLEHLSIGDIEKKATFECSAACTNLTNLTVKDIAQTGQIKNLYLLNTLQDLSIGNLNINLSLPITLTNLITLSIGDIAEDVAFTIPCSLPNLKFFSIGTFYHSHNLQIQGSLPNLTNLSMESIWNDRAFQVFGNLPNLSSLFVKNICVKATDALLCSLPKLFDFSVENILDGASLRLLNPLSFTSFSIRNILQSGILHILGEYRNLTNIYIGGLQKDAKLLILGSLPELTTLYINNIQEGSDFKLATASKLEKLLIKNVGAQVDFILPTTLSNLKMLTLENVKRNVILALPANSFQKLEQLTINGHEALRLDNNQFSIIKNNLNNDNSYKESLILLELINKQIKTSATYPQQGQENCSCQ